MTILGGILYLYTVYINSTMVMLVRVRSTQSACVQLNQIKFPRLYGVLKAQWVGGLVGICPQSEVAGQSWVLEGLCNCSPLTLADRNRRQKFGVEKVTMRVAVSGTGEK